MNELLTRDKARLQLFEDGITIDKNLPKWKNANAKLSEKRENAYIIRETYTSTNGTSFTNSNSPVISIQNSDNYSVGNDVNFDEIASANLRELTEIIKSTNIMHILSGYGGMNGFGSSIYYDSSSRDVNIAKDKVKNNLWNRLILAFKGKPKELKPEIDVIDFFTQIKALSKESAQEYVDRVSKYLKAIHNAKTTGQTALIENLLKGMITNKYESLLHAEGYYYAVSEKQVVDFAKKTSKGVSLTYLKNFIRPLPEDVMDKLEEVNKLEVFDNYLILHYDPLGTSYKETEKEIAKRKDPILFGVIAGSNKLYYVTGWIDEYCNLTLDSFVDTLGIKKDSLDIDNTK